MQHGNSDGNLDDIELSSLISPTHSIRSDTTPFEDNSSSSPQPNHKHGTRLFPYKDDLLLSYTRQIHQESLGTKFINYLSLNYLPKSFAGLVYGLFPFLAIGQRGYRLSDFKSDLISGLTLAVVLIPQSLAYAPLAGLSPQYGLYNAFLTPMIYMFLGTTRELSLGPFALVSLVIFETISKMYPSLNRDEPNDMPFILLHVVTLTFCVGIWLLLMAILKLGWIMDLFSAPAVSGLIMASALTITMSQMGTLFQVSVGQGSFIQMVIELFKNIGATNAASFIIGAICTIILCGTDILSQRLKLKTPIPGQILLVIIVTAISYVANFHERFNVAVIGEITMGIPSPPTPQFSDIFKTTLSSGYSNSIPPYLMNSLPIALICFIISAAVSTEMSNKNKYPINYNNELFALSACSLIGSFVNCYTSSASLSRTAVVDATKPATIMWNVVSTVVLGFVLFVVASLLFHTPKSILAAIVISSFRGAYMKLGAVYEIYQQSRGEALVYAITFLACLCISTPIGLIAAFISSLWYVVYSTSMSPSLTLRQVGLTHRYVNYELLQPYSVQEYIEMMRTCCGDGSDTDQTPSSWVLDHHIDTSKQLPPHFYDHRVTVIHVRQPLTFLNHNILSTQVRRLVKQVRNRHYNPAPTDYDDQLMLPPGSDDGFVHPVNPDEGLNGDAPSASGGDNVPHGGRPRRRSVSVHATHRSGGMLPPEPLDSSLRDFPSLPQQHAMNSTGDESSDDETIHIDIPLGKSSSQKQYLPVSTSHEYTQSPHSPQTLRAKDEGIHHPTRSSPNSTVMGMSSTSHHHGSRKHPQEDEHEGDHGDLVELLTKPLQERVVATNRRNVELLSVYDQTLLSSMTRDLMENPTDTIRGYKHVIILDSISAIDTTAHITLHKLIKAYQEFLFLFTNPSMTFFSQFMTDRLTHRPSSNLPKLTAPSNFAFPHLHMAVLFGITLLDSILLLPPTGGAQSTDEGGDLSDGPAHPDGGSQGSMAHDHVDPVPINTPHIPVSNSSPPGYHQTEYNATSDPNRDFLSPPFNQFSPSKTVDASFSSYTSAHTDAHEDSRSVLTVSRAHRHSYDDSDS